MNASLLTGRRMSTDASQHRTLSLTLTLAMTASLMLCETSRAQSTVVSPNSNYVLSEGGGATTTFGSYASGRYQFADGNFRNSAMSVTALEFRYDHYDYSIHEGMGRTWNNVKVRLSETNLAGFGGTFSQNSTSTPSLLFDGTVNWPIQLGIPSFLPSVWSNKVPLTGAYAYSGTEDLLTDFTFTGGSLANSAPWSGNTAVPYRLDSFNIGTFVDGPSTILGQRNGGCIDSSMSGPTGASIEFKCSSYGPNYATPSLRNKFQFEATGTNFAPNHPTVFVLAFAANSAGIEYPGVACNRLYLTLVRMWFLYPVTVNAAGNVPPFYFGYPGGVANYDPTWRGINVVAQGVWDDSRTQNLKFSTLARNSFLSLPPETVAEVKLKTAFDPNPAAATATSVKDGDSSSIPVIRYTN